MVGSGKLEVRSWKWEVGSGKLHAIAGCRVKGKASHFPIPTQNI